jgi:transcriptional regulator with XRE-family HTH domain
MILWSIMNEKRNEVLREARLKLNLTQAALSEYLGISYGTYSLFEVLKAYPSDEMQRKLCKYFSEQGINISKKELFPEEIYGGAYKSNLGKKPNSRKPETENRILINTRKKLGLSQIELSEILNIHNSSYADYEKLHRYPPIKHQKIISEYFIKNGFALFEEDIFPKALYMSSTSPNESEINELEFISLNDVDESKLPVVENQYVRDEIFSTTDSLVSRMINSGRYVFNAIGEKKWIYELKDRERSALTKHYIEGKTFEAVGDEIKLSGVRAQQLCRSGVRQLKRMRHQYFDDLNFDRDNKLVS